MLLLIDDHEAEALEVDALRQDRVSADDDVDSAVGNALLGPLGFGSGHQPRQPPDVERKALKPLGEIPIMLASKQRRWTNERHLAARHGHDKGGAKRDLCFAEADIAADQSVHRLAGFEVLEDVGDRAVLI